MKYSDCFMECIANRDLVAQYDRLKEKMLGVFLNEMLKETEYYWQLVESGQMTAEIKEFDKFVYEFIWPRVQRGEAIKQIGLN